MICSSSLMKSEYNFQVFVHIVQCTVVVVSYFFLIQLLYQNVPYGYRLADKQPNNIMIYRWHILSPQWLGQETVNVEYHFNVWTLLCTPQFDILSSFHLPLSGVLTIGVAAQLGWAPCYFNSPALCCVLFHTHTRNKISLRMVKTK